MDLLVTDCDAHYLLLSIKCDHKGSRRPQVDPAREYVGQVHAKDEQICIRDRAARQTPYRAGVVLRGKRYTVQKTTQRPTIMVFIV